MFEKEPERNRPKRIPQKDPLVEIFKQSSQKNLSWLATGFHNGSFQRRQGYQLALWSWAAAFIDLLVLISASSVFLIAFSFIINSPLKNILGQCVISNVYELFSIIFILAVSLYLVSLRVLVGQTVGEWACDLRLGRPNEHLKISYSLRVLIRTFVILSTGVIFLPILSLIFGKDIPGQISGVKIFSLV